MSGTVRTPVSDANGKLQAIRTMGNDLNARLRTVHQKAEAIGKHITWQKAADAYFASKENPQMDPGYADYEAGRKTPEQHLDMLKQLTVDIHYTYTSSIKLVNELSDHAKIMNELSQQELRSVIRPTTPANIGGISGDATKASPEQAAQNEAMAQQRSSLTYEPAPKL